MSAEQIKSIYRYVVPIGGHYWITLTGDPIAVAAVDYPAGVEFWAEISDDRPARRRAFQVYGTGHPVPVSAKWWGTTARTADGLVWHLYELAIEDPEQSGEASR